MRENGFLDDAPGIGTVRDILQGKRPIVTAKPDARLRDVIDQMKSLSISQLPVVDKGKMRGIVAEVDLLRALVSGGKTLESPIAEVVEDDYATVTPNTKIELLQGVLADAKVAIVEDRDEIVGIVTKIDLIDFLAKHKASPASVPPAA
jgi:cystathionine beta-synthase